VICVSGEPFFSAGHTYRIERVARTLSEIGYAVDVVGLDELTPAWRKSKAQSPDLIIIWRAARCSNLEAAISAWRRAGARILFDVDDYMFDTTLAHADIIDGIRSQNINVKNVIQHYRGIRETLESADACMVPTHTLAKGIAICGKLPFISVNGFDAETYSNSRKAVLRRRFAPHDGHVRIGYAAGSRTHQRDFAVAAPAIAAVLREQRQCVLVLFRDAIGGRELLDLSEFPEFQGLESQIEWRPFTTLDRLPEELARFDLNIAPLEIGNVYCEAKSELKYFESALVSVPTVASPTQPFRDAIIDGVTGFLAADTAAWQDRITRLVAEPRLRAEVGQAALHHVLHKYGPDGRRQRLGSIMRRVVGTELERGSNCHLDYLRHSSDVRLPQVPPAEIVWQSCGNEIAKVAVVVPLFNYGVFLPETLESVMKQTLDSVELVVIDDHSTDASLEIAANWLEQCGGRFVRATLLRNPKNRGLALTRNIGFAHAEAPFIFPLDADNALDPGCLLTLHQHLSRSQCSAAHPTLQRFGLCKQRHAAQAWSPERLRQGNYIDAMAMIRKSAWAHVGGYTKGGFVGWEDYELWCKFVECGLWSDPVPDAVAHYRVHGASMLQATTNPSMPAVVKAIRAAHPWLTVKVA
jgi:glycosyltransferase involved in cell wall biosynthesis